MKRLNFERIAIVIIAIVIVFGFYIQEQKISKLENTLEKIDIPIEKKDGYWVEISEIPQELLEKEIIK